ncbi:RBBP9/YdeN family alpha/beta hydrolase [Nocardia gamkensis]|uniref:Serine hydrolase family protein n=1 Tax=Nocardia gamkensis TaxID=352869 RepID=A0A7X6L444_9NOCA|nr:alpha/beta hydrolase [Nocardia gamkensis]NKY27496.1 serine hydrolase family protein [Nocardia gamkensis]NQE66026.1 putative hydrolase YdeN [Nocardia gamkensis]
MTSQPTHARAVVIHGYRATPDDHWFPWLADRLDAAGTPTYVPALPGADDPDRVAWLAATAKAVGTPDKGTAVIAHSLGCLTVLRYLAALPGEWRLGHLILVAGFLDPLPALPELDAYIESGCDVSAIPEHLDHLTIFRSDEDELVPTTHTDRLAGLLGVTARAVPGAGHFLADDGITELAEVVDALQGVRPSGGRATRSCARL